MPSKKEVTEEFKLNKKDEKKVQKLQSQIEFHAIRGEKAEFFFGNLNRMPAATKQMPKPAAKEHAKGLESDEALDLILAKYTEKRSQQLLNDNSLFVAKEAKKTDLGTKAARRARRKELQAKGSAAQGEQQGDDYQECMRCGQFSCKLVNVPARNGAEGAFDCALCLKPGQAAAGVWHCFQCNADSHVACYSRKKEAMELADKAPHDILSHSLTEADCPKPSLAWDPLVLTGPHMAIGAGAGVRGVGEVALD